MTKVHIIGGGIAGLALAGKLDPGQFDITIHEQRPELPAVGTTLAMWAGAQAALAGLGLLESLQNRGSRLTSGALRDPAGRALLSMEGEGLVGISRPALLQLLDSAVPPTVQRLTQKVDRIPRGASVVVGADGVHSAVRRQAWGTGKAARPTPALAVRGVVPGTPAPDDVGEYWGRGNLFGLAPAAGEGTNWYASFRSSLGPWEVDVEEALEQTRHLYAGHSPAVREVLARATPETSLAQRIWTAPPMRTYTRREVVLLGDAAHAMTPNLGRGACEALVDAVSLGALLNERPWADALREYNRKRVIRTQQLKVASSLMGRVALAQALQPLRDALLTQAGKGVSRRKTEAKTPE